jgi:hypothetical protein
VAIAVLDLVSRYWIATLVSAEETSERVVPSTPSPWRTRGCWPKPSGA